MGNFQGIINPELAHKLEQEELKIDSFHRALFFNKTANNSKPMISVLSFNIPTKGQTWMSAFQFRKNGLVTLIKTYDGTK